MNSRQEDMSPSYNGEATHVGDNVGGDKIVYVNTIDDKPKLSPTLGTTIPTAVNLIGREKDIVAILELWKQHNIVSIHAGGGVGKTAIAANILNTIKPGAGPYTHIAWITSTGALKDDLMVLDIPYVNEARSQAEKYNAVCIFLQTTPTFLVIDNMDKPLTKDEADLLNTITVSGKTKILITTRSVIPCFERYPLNDLDEESALILFYRYYRKNVPQTIEEIRKQQDYRQAGNIIRAANRNALFVELIGKMAYADHWKLDKLWEKIKLDVIGQDSKHPVYTMHGDGKLTEQVKKLYALSGLSERQRDIMSFIALFPPEHSIFFDVFNWAGFEDDKVDNLGALQERGWIERDEEGYLIHTMVKRSVSLQQDKTLFDEDKYANLISELADINQYMPEDMLYSKVHDRIIVPDTICRLLMEYGSEKTITSDLYNKIAVVYYTQGNYDEALKFFGKAMAIREKILGLEHLDTAVTYNNIAIVYQAQGSYEEALKFYGKAMEIKEKALGPEHLDTAITYNNMAGVYTDQGKYEEALKFYWKAMAIEEKVLGPEHPNTATVYNNMAGVYREQGSCEEAARYFEKALTIYKKKLGLNHPYTKNTEMILDIVKKKLKNPDCEGSQ